MRTRMLVPSSRPEPAVSVHDVLDRLRTWVAVIAVDGTVLDIAGGDGWYFGHRNEEVIGRNTLEFLDVASAEALIDTFMQGPESKIYARPVSFPVNIIDVDGASHRTEIIPAGFEMNGQRGWAVTITRLDVQAPSVTALHQIVQGNSIHEAAAAVAKLLTYASPDGVWHTVVAVDPSTDSGKLVAGRAESAVSTVLESWLGPRHVDSGTDQTALWDRLGPNELRLFQIDEVPADLAIAMHTDDATQALVMRVDTNASLGMVVVQLINDHNNGGVSGNTVLHLTELQTVLTRAVEREIGFHALADRASRDPLTGLLNRAGFAGNITARCDDGAVIFVDLDRFKSVNDTYGHAVGDIVLVEIANRLRWACRPGDLVARLGGDEFAILIRSGGKDVAEVVARRLLDSIAKPLHLDVGPAQVTASVGVAGLSTSVELAAALASADAAMFEAKQRGRAMVVTQS